MIIAISTGLGLQDAIKNKVAHFSGHVVLKAYANNDSYQSLPIEGDLEILEQKAPFPFQAHAFASRAAILKSTEEFDGILFKGLADGYPLEFIQEYLQTGSSPAYADSLAGKILMSSLLAKKLQVEIGEKVALYFLERGSRSRVRTFILAGTFKTGIEFYDESLVLGNLGVLAQLGKWDEEEVGGIEIRLESYEDLEEAKQYFHENSPMQIQAKGIDELYPQLFQWIGLFDLNIMVVLIIMVLVAGINMITALLIMMIERSPMIGLLKALGAENVLVRKVFLRNGMRLLLRGLLWGNAIGLLLLFLQDQFGWMKLDESTYYVSAVPVVFPWHWFLLLNLSTAVLTLLMLWLPSRFVSNLQPVKAIRFE